VDATGLVTLETHETDLIRALGFDAQVGPWCVPPLPADLVAGNPLLEHLGESADPFWKPRGGHEAPQAAILRDHSAKTQGVTDAVSPWDGAQGGNPRSTESLSDSPTARTPLHQAVDPALEKECTSVLAAVERAGGRIAKRLLQKKLWRIRAEQFNEVIRSLVGRGEIQIEEGTLIAQPVPRSDSNQFQVVPQSGEDVPRKESLPGLTRAPDQLMDFGGRGHKVIENAN
jgi:hypothetical protein